MISGSAGNVAEGALEPGGGTAVARDPASGRSMPAARTGLPPLTLPPLPRAPVRLSRPVCVQMIERGALRASELSRHDIFAIGFIRRRPARERLIAPTRAPSIRCLAHPAASGCKSLTHPIEHEPFSAGGLPQAERWRTALQIARASRCASAVRSLPRFLPPC